ncbi:hypothetical protein TIFTF001_026399 [Ficus carica]|uniref:Uncharacterized protein n=1 Tax=Ficus carica TaxID=3494 RepID=A0AA88IY15_FICCA|nr:hypothetical protein TIFTF001_026399 [Ficus carica]
MQIPMIIFIIIMIIMRIHIRYLHSHAAATLRTNGGGFIRHVSVIRRTHEEVTGDDFPLRLMLVLGQEEERNVLTSHSSGRFGLQKYVLVLVWLNVSLAHIFHARVEVSEEAHHAVLGQEPDDGADGEREDVKQKIYELFPSFRE